MEPKDLPNVRAFLVECSKDVRGGSLSSRIEAVVAVTETGKEKAVVG